MTESRGNPERFGTLLGFASGGVPVYSSDYASADDEELPDRHSYRSYVDSIYMGQKWQCVEFARRWLYLNHGLIFDDIGMAYEIFELSTIRDVRNGRILPLRAFRNGSRRPPVPGALIVWDKGGTFENTGHVAIVEEVTADRVRFSEQNFDHLTWPDGRDYAREIKATRTPTGEFWVESSFADATILGWVIQTDDDTDAEPIESPDPELLQLMPREVPAEMRDDRAWLNVANSDEAAYVDYMEGHFLSDVPRSEYLYFLAAETAREELERATHKLHALFMHATDYVLRDDELLSRFGIPQSLWPKIHQSWNNRRNQMITGRLDFAMTERGLKVYEYNCDSAGCYMETGKIQAKWAEHYGCDLGVDSGATLHDHLRDAWKRSGVEGLVHVMQDDDPEETYHALFMQEAMERAGIDSHRICGTQELQWGRDGGIIDAQGRPLRWVWKTWAWETALDQIRAECDDDPEKLRDYRPGEPHDGPVRLVDVLLRSEVMVYEPLWTLIPSNKAILPVLWSLFPNHPYLLETSFELTPTLREKGYVAKPIVGRCGSNVSIFDRSEQLLEETGGRFEARDVVYQELFPLDKSGGVYSQPSTFWAGGTYAGTGVRVDASMVITGTSENVALRFVEDELFLAQRAATPTPGTTRKKE